MKSFLYVIAFFFSTSVFAHPGHADTFMSAVIHPFLGWDHLLTMLIVGVMASLLPAKKGVVLPVLFVSFFSIFTLLASQFSLSDVQHEILEQCILAAMIILPLVHFMIARLPSWTIFSVIGLMGSIHGLTHGLELNVYSNFSILGLVLSTALIHAIGFLLGTYFKNNHDWILKSLTIGTGLLGAIGLIQTF